MAFSVPTVILATDPGKVTGWAVVVWLAGYYPKVLDYGRIKAPPKIKGVLGANVLEREVYQELGLIIDRHRPAEVVMEARQYVEGGTDQLSIGAYYGVQARMREVNTVDLASSQGHIWGSYAPISCGLELFGDTGSHTDAEYRRRVESWFRMQFPRSDRESAGYHVSHALAVAATHLIRCHGWRPAGYVDRSRLKVAPETLAKLSSVYDRARGIGGA